MQDFSLASLKQACAQAQSIITGGKFDQLIDGCREAQHDLCWEAQFAKLIPLLERVLNGSARS